MKLFLTFATFASVSVASANDCCETAKSDCSAALYNVGIEYSKGITSYNVCCTEEDLQEDTDLGGIPLCEAEQTDGVSNVFDDTSNPPSCCEQFAAAQETRGIDAGGIARGIDGRGGARGLGITRTGIMKEARGITGTGARGIDGGAIAKRGIDSGDGRGIDAGDAKSRAVGCQGNMVDMNVNYQKASKYYNVCCDAGYEDAINFGGIPMCTQDAQDTDVEPNKNGVTAHEDVCCTAAQGSCPADKEVTDVDTSPEGQIIEVCCNPGSSINIEFADLSQCEAPSSTTRVHDPNNGAAKESFLAAIIAMTAVAAIVV